MDSDGFTLISRDGWKARASQELLPLDHPIPYVVIHHSYEPGACNNKEDCAAAMRKMQDHHMDDNKWPDIGYSFAVGGDGCVYEANGWSIEAGHAAYFNTVSLGICLIGDWSNTLPPVEQLKVTQALISYGVQNGYLAKDYKLVGHRQIRETECPGDVLFEHIKTWDNYSTFPASAPDLLTIDAIPDELKNRLRKRLGLTF